ncbi:MAG: DUF1570 domain-containing protein [Planctomycetaceae bacterium]
MARLSAAILATSWLAAAQADHWRYRDELGRSVEVEARLAGSGQGLFALELADGEYRLVADGAVESRQPADGPAPLSADAVAAKLLAQFGAERFRSAVREPYVMGLVLSAPLPKANEARAKNFLQQAAAFLKNVDAALVAFVKEARIPFQKLTFPLPVLIFESQTDFDAYAGDQAVGRGLAAQNIAGFYSKLTNVLAIRLSECRTFDVPLHEAIHQQVYNRQVLQRLAPIPTWFDEGIATGFEGSEGRVSLGPTKISSRYARQVLAARQVTFESILADDRAFGGDVLVGEAYGRAWALHWLLVTKYRNQYGRFVRLLADRQPLQKLDSDQRLADFRDAFGKDVSDVEREFALFFDASLKRQNIALRSEKTPGLSLTHEALGEVELTAVNRVDTGAGLEVQGRLTNTSPLRALAFYVTVETDGGTYAGWHIPALDIQKSTPLPVQYAAAPISGARAGPARTFRVRIRSAPTGSADAEAWQKGHLPVPTEGG